MVFLPRCMYLFVKGEDNDNIKVKLNEASSNKGEGGKLKESLECKNEAHKRDDEDYENEGDGEDDGDDENEGDEIGRASCRERV